MKHIQGLRWDVGALLPTEIKSNLSLNELDYFAKYNDIVNQYMKTVDMDLGEVLRFAVVVVLCPPGVLNFVGSNAAQRALRRSALFDRSRPDFDESGTRTS